MSYDKEDNLKTCKASKKSIEQAIEILKSTKAATNQSNEVKIDNKNERKYQSACTSHLQHQKDIFYGSIFYTDPFGFKMQNCMINQDWDNLIRLLSSFLETNSEGKEQIIWKYAIAVMLHYPGRTVEDITDFLKICIGCHEDSDIEYMLEQILTFPINKDKTNNLLNIPETRRFLRVKRKLN